MPFQYGGEIAANFILAAGAQLPALCMARPMLLNVDYVSAGDPSKPRVYIVKELRQTGKFIHTLVTLKQSKQVVAVGTCIFHSNEHEEKSLNYLPQYPEDCCLPKDLKTLPELMDKMKDK